MLDTYYGLHAVSEGSLVLDSASVVVLVVEDIISFLLGTFPTPKPITLAGPEMA